MNTPAHREPGALVELHSPRFTLRSMTREDVNEALIGWLADPEVMLGLNQHGQRLSRLEAVRWVLEFDNQRRFLLGIFTREGGGMIGFFMVTVDTAHATAETAVVVGERSWWGKDVVREARARLLDFLFDELNMHKVTGRPHGRNFASIYNYRALGFTCEAVLRQQMKALGGEGRLDQLLFGLLKSEWQARP